MDEDRQTRIDSWIEQSLAIQGNGPFSELIRLHRGRPVQIEPLESMLAKIEARKDCADFQVAGFVRIVYQFPESDGVPPALARRIRQTLLGFKYWPDEPGTDDMCSWTENHYILFASAGYLAGQGYPDEVFRNSGLSGRQMVERFLPRVRQWLDLRFATGFSEWLSNVYYNEDIPALFNLIDFAEDEEIRTRAAMVLDLLLADLALNSYEGIFASTHGRSYDQDKKYGGRESTASIAGLLFGGESFQNGNFSAVSLILSSYEVPPILAEMARNHLSEADLNRQISGFDLRDGRRFGLDRRRVDHGMTFLTSEAYMHPRFISTFLKMLDAYNWWDNGFFVPLRPYRMLLRFLKVTALLRPFFKALERDTNRGYREPAHIYTYRTPDYMMSSAQNYRPGFGGDQQSSWQVTLGGDATCFITHPGKSKAHVTGATPNYWTGYGTLPAVAQYRNCAIMIYRINTRPGLYVTNREIYTHAWFPVSEFDEVAEEGSWIFAAKREGYLALWSQIPTEWGEDGDGRSEILARGKNNIWICQAGSRSESGSFREFQQAFLLHEPERRKRGVSFHSPGNGTLGFSWKGDLLLDGKAVELKGSYRYNNTFGMVSYPAQKVEFSSGDLSLRLDWQECTRSFR